MKKRYTLGICLLLLLTACSEDAATLPEENPGEGETLTACFELNTLSLQVGETLQVSNCSEGATSYFYDFGNGQTSEEENPVISYSEGGSYTISLTVTNGDQQTDVKTKSVMVLVVEANYLFPEIPDGFTGFPMETGINPLTGNLYSIELYQDNKGPLGSKYFYREFDEDFMFASNYIADKPYEGASAFVNFYPGGKMNFVFSRTLGSLYGSQEVNYNSVWTFLNTINSSTKHSYGFLTKGTDYLYFGAQEDVELYKAAIEKRNSTGDAYDVVLHSFGTSSAMIGDMIEVSGGYVAYGAVFAKNATLPYVSGYKPLLVYMDADLNVTEHIIYEDTDLTAKISSFDDLNGSYHLEALSNGNLVMYSNAELMVTDASGAVLSRTFFSDTSNNQALVSLGDSFVISTDRYLRKFNNSGVEIAQLKYNGNYLPELINKDNTLYFIAGYDKETDIKIFYGACDYDLTLIDLSP